MELKDLLHIYKFNGHIKVKLSYYCREYKYEPLEYVETEEDFKTEDTFMRFVERFGETVVINWSIDTQSPLLILNLAELIGD